MHTNTFCKYRKNYSHRLACILLLTSYPPVVSQAESQHGHVCNISSKPVEQILLHHYSLLTIDKSLNWINEQRHGMGIEAWRRKKPRMRV